MGNHPLFSVVVLNYNGKGLLDSCLVSLLKSDYPNLEIVLVDNASTDSSVEFAEPLFRNDSRVRVIRNKRNLFYTGGNNIGINSAKGEYILILNNDTEVEPDCLSELSLVMSREDVGATQPKIFIYGEPSLIDNTGGLMDVYGYTKGRGAGEVDKGQFDNDNNIFYAGGTAMALKRIVLDKVGIFEPKFVAHWEDVDLSWRIRLAGYRIVFASKAIIRHKVSGTISKFGNKHEISFHIRKNRVAGLIKNYGFLSLSRFLPFTVFLYFTLFLKEFFWNRKIPLAFTSITALLWNIKELPYLLKERKNVQRKIRVLSDREIVKYMYSKAIALERYFKA